MKIKHIFLILNLLIIVSFLIIVGIPLLSFKEVALYSSFVMQQNIVFSSLFIGLLIIINFFYFSQKKILEFFENQQWQELYEFLKIEIYIKKKITKNKATYFINTLIYLKKFQEIEEFSKFLKENNKINIAHDLVLLLNLPLFYQNRLPELLIVLEPLKGTTKNYRECQWVSVLYSFILFQDQRFNDLTLYVQSIFLKQKSDIVKIYLLFFMQLSYLVIKQEKGDALTLDDFIVEQKKIINNRVKQSDWDSLITKEESQSIYCVTFNKILNLENQAKEWFFN